MSQRPRELLVSSVANAATIDIDRPFLFLVRDNSTGAILFEAAVANPAA